MRQPFAILGAIGLLGLVDELVHWQEQIGAWVAAWRAFTGPIAQALLGWLVELLPWSLPEWWMDYAVVGAISGLALSRSYVSVLQPSPDFRGPEWVFTLVHSVVGVVIFVPIAIPLWPAVILIVLQSYLLSPGAVVEGKVYTREHIRLMTAVFSETFVWASLLIAVNYALLAAGL